MLPVLTLLLLCFTLKFISTDAMPAEVKTVIVRSQLSFCQGSCEKGWVVFDDRCYQFFPTKMSENDAEESCVSLGGHLASVLSADNNQFVNSLIRSIDKSGPATWLGGCACEKVGDWKWIDGSKWDYSNWKPGEPNNSRNKERCLQMMSIGQWNDANCAVQMPFVCMKKID
ncbi:LECA protein, partial [Polypterus senegalus]|nr:galactose-specific lectin nattectin-like [Polypterus senegalus]XP_039630206.1 galactose-specific lectin nattectin-like [Polypterus senegalus]MBN3292990.1 LECA protein [Polypterus senegalus]